MGLREDLLERFGPFNDQGREFAFDLMGRDPGELGGLREFGKLRIEAGKVIVTLNKAARKVIKLERAAERAARRVERASLTATRTGRSSTMRNAFGFSDDGIKAGPVLIGRAGMSPNRAFLRNATGGAFTASVGVHLAGSGMSAYADATEKINEMKSRGATSGEMRRQIGAAASGAVFNTIATLTGAKSLAKGEARLDGVSEEEFEADYQGLIAWMSNSREEVERIRNAFAEKRLEVQRQTDLFFRKLWERINSTLPQTFTLRGKRELEVYRRDMRDLNAGSIEARQRDVRLAQGRQARKEARGLP